MNGAAHVLFKCSVTRRQPFWMSGALAIASAVAYTPPRSARSGGDFASKYVPEKALHARGRDWSRSKARRGQHPL